jgi:hypothetical protein
MLLLALALIAPQPAGGRTRTDATAPRQTLRSVRAALDRVAPAYSANDPVARFTDPICAASSGLPAQADRIIVDRIAALAASAGLQVARPGCAPNVRIVFVADGRAAMRRLFHTRPAAVTGQSVQAMNRLIAEPSPARAWIETEIRSRDGDRPSYSPVQAPGLPVATSSHLSLPIRRDILSATVMIDRDAAAGVPLTQIADYAAMRALTGARADARLGQRSILSMFTGPISASPEAATAFDQGYLRGLYEGRGDLPYTIKSAAIVSRIADFEGPHAR